MFGFLKNLFKRKPKTPKAEEPKAEEVVKGKDNKKKIDYKPEFGTVEAFVEKYGQGDKHLIIGRKNNEGIAINAASEPCNDILFINDNSESVRKDIIMPLVRQGNMSYVIYDPDGEYYEALGNNMLDRGYDVQVIDFDDEEKKSRISLFEIVNITQNAYWVATVFASASGCTAEEAPVAHNALMAIMAYLLNTKNAVYAEDLINMMKSVFAKPEETIAMLNKCPSARQHEQKLKGCSHELLKAAIKKCYVLMMKNADYVKNPNVFAATAHKKKSVFFVKNVKKENVGIMTSFLFNLRTSGIIFGKGEVNLVIIDASTDKWYSKVLFNRMSKEGNFEQGTVNVSVRPNVGPDDNPYVRPGQLIVYQHSEDEKTRKFVKHFLKASSMLTDDEKANLSKTHFKGKAVPEEAWDKAALSTKQLDRIEYSVFFDTKKTFKPFRCDRLV